MVAFYFLEMERKKTIETLLMYESVVHFFFYYYLSTSGIWAV